MAITMFILYNKSEDHSCIKASWQSTKLPTEEENIQDFQDFMMLKNEAHISSPKSTIRTRLFFYFLILFLNFTLFAKINVWEGAYSRGLILNCGIFFNTQKWHIFLKKAISRKKFIGPEWFLHYHQQTRVSFSIFASSKRKQCCIAIVMWILSWSEILFCNHASFE